MRAPHAIPRADSASSDMRSLRSTPRRALRLAAVSATMCAAGFAASTIPAGCLTAAPPTLPDVQHRPTILPDESPEVDVPLVDWPMEFQRIRASRPRSLLLLGRLLGLRPWRPLGRAVRDSYGVRPPRRRPRQRFLFSPTTSSTGSATGLISSLAPHFGVGSPTMPSYFHTPTGALGGDVVTWWYTGGLGLGSCSPYGGPLPDGGFPLPDASSDSPPPVPE